MLSSAMLERDRELAALGGALADAGAGSGRLAVVEGPAAPGMSSLLAAAIQRAEGDGMRDAGLGAGVASKSIFLHQLAE